MVGVHFVGTGSGDWRTWEAEKWARRQTEKGLYCILFFSPVLECLNYDAQKLLIQFRNYIFLAVPELITAYQVCVYMALSLVNSNECPMQLCSLGSIILTDMSVALCWYYITLRYYCRSTPCWHLLVYASTMQKKKEISLMKQAIKLLHI